MKYVVKTLRFIFALAVLAGPRVMAQTVPIGTPERPPWCATMPMDTLSRERFPERGTLNDLEKTIQKEIKHIADLKKAGRLQETILTIPIIVHVVNNGEPVGSGTNLSQAQVQAQLEVLNEDFRKKPGTPGYNTNPVGADIEIEFCLSSLDKNGNVMVEPGIDRIVGSKSAWSRDDIENLLKPSTIWDPNHFYNVWTVNFSASEAGLLGYAQFPDQSGLPGLPTSGPALTDGVVIRYRNFGSVDKGNFPIMQSPYNKGRTLTHETGHYLGLRHIWGDGNCADDFVGDTPPESGPSSGCPTGRISCGGLNMIENYMDYSDDGCMNIFTEGQKSRMQAVMMVSPRRKTLIESNLCSPSATNPPVTNFTSNANLCVLLGSEVDFTDLSSNFPTEWHWTFEGGEPAESTLRNPRITYNASGSFSVTLYTKNSIGESDTLLSEHYVNVSDQGLCNSQTNFDDSYTPSLLKLSAFGNYKGYLAGQNNVHISAISERFSNDCNYKYIHGVDIRFGKAYAAQNNATVSVIVWNARGPQGAPGAVIERKDVLLKQIKEDIQNQEATTVIFDRETPLFGAAYHVGIELSYEEGDTVAVFSSADGEAVSATSWLKDPSGTLNPENGGSVWSTFTVALGANIALAITPKIGMKPSVQISTSKLLALPGEEVILNGHGASIFLWNADNGTVVNYTGPQLIVHPTETTTYLTTGSGLDLCYDSAYTTIFIREDVTGIEGSGDYGIRILPNPGTSSLTVQIENSYVGNVRISMYSLWGQEAITALNTTKQEPEFERTLETGALRAGLYLVTIDMGGKRFVKKWIKP